jgi:hypothetical protein
MVVLGPIAAKCCFSSLLDITPGHSMPSTNIELAFVDRAGTITHVVPIDHKELTPALYPELVKDFTEAQVWTHQLHRSTNHAIDMVPSYLLSYVQIFNPSESRVRIAKAYIAANVENEFIELLLSLVVEPILLAKKKHTR